MPKDKAEALNVNEAIPVVENPEIVVATDPEGLPKSAPSKWPTVTIADRYEGAIPVGTEGAKVADEGGSQGVVTNHNPLTAAEVADTTDREEAETPQGPPLGDDVDDVGGSCTHPFWELLWLAGYDCW